MLRTVKSYVLRAGRVSPRQQQGLDRWLAPFALAAPPARWDFAEIFGRLAPTVVEIGFGMGASLARMAADNPETNFIGIEVHRAGVGSLAADVHDLALKNVRIAPFDAVEVFAHCIEDGSLAGVNIFFPDPWPKARHHKRRLVQEPFMRLVAQKLKPQGVLHAATDWEPYAEQMFDVFNAIPMLRNLAPESGFSPRPESRPLTKFEERGTRLGHGVWDLRFERL